MTEIQPTCPDCSGPYATTDNYCRQCGMYLAALRTVATIPAGARALEPIRPALPVPVRRAATALAVGTALQVAVGLTGKYLARQAAKQAVASVRPGKAVAKRAASQPAQKPAVIDDPMDGATAVSETLFIQRVWMRRRP